MTDPLVKLWRRAVAGRKYSQVRRAVRFAARRDPRRLRVLFVCVGNACRSQMAEAFANTYGRGLLTARSAGLRPAAHIPRLTHRVMEERGISLRMLYPKHIHAFHPASFDLVVNLTRYRVRGVLAPLLQFPVPDPIGKSPEFHRAVRNTVEHLVETMLTAMYGERDAWSLHIPEHATPPVPVNGRTA